MTMKKVTCSGMERSGSTLTWQMACMLLGQEVAKTHEYVEGDTPIVYTYRHPVEAYFSLRRCFIQIYPESAGTRLAIEAVKIQTKIFKRLLEDSRNGRDVLFLRYEDYYYKPELRLSAIRIFLGKEKDQKLCKNILKETSLEKNILKSSGRGNFGSHDKSNGLHGGHIDPDFKGVPGAILHNLSKILPAGDPGWNNPILREACKVFGY